MCNNAETEINMDSSKAEAWECCQDIYWLFVMLDDSRYSSSVGCNIKFRQYACQVARSYWYLLAPTARESIEDLERLLTQRISEVEDKLIPASLVTVKADSIEIKERLQLAAKIAQNATDKNIRSNISAALTTKYALKLGADEKILVDCLKLLIGNPYLMNLKLVVRRNYWQIPKHKNVFERLGKWFTNLLDVNREQVKAFYNFLEHCSSLGEAWEKAHRVDWMLAMLDLYSNYADTSTAQKKFRQFLCWLAREDPYFYTTKVDQSVRLAVQIAEHFIQEQATCKDLKLAEIVVTEASRNYNFYNIRVTELGLYCTYQSAWIGMLKANRYNHELVSAIKLRELISNPFE